MNKYLLSAGMVLLVGLTQAQITGYVLGPSSVQGPLDFTWAEWTNTPNLNTPGLVFQGFAEFVDDGTAADSLGCNALTNDLAGKFAVIYRGDCEFGMKALNAENAGAIGVVIINNIGGTLVMGAGVVGDQVTIPVIMISTPAGAMLRNEILAGNVELLLGNFTGQFPQNLGINRFGVLAPPSAGAIALLAQNAGELSVDLGAWIRNYGTATNSSARLLTTVEYDGAIIYEHESDAVSVNAGDSVWVAVPTFSQSSYTEGYYAITYTALSDDEDGFPADNSLFMDLNLRNVFTYAQGEMNTGIPISTTFTTSADANNFTYCIHFTNPNSSRVIATGMFVMATTQTIDNPLEDEVIEITANLWTDAMSGPFTLPTPTGLSLLTQGLHVFSDSERTIPVYVPFDEPVILENGDRYLFCMETFGTAILAGFNGKVSYDEHINNYQEPVSLLRNAGEWFNGFTDFDAIPSLGVVMVDANTIGINELDALDITPYPNPANDIIRIPLQGITGAATLEIFTMSGAKVAEQRVSVGGNDLLLVNVAGISNGSYIFHMNLEDGRTSSFRVVVAR